MQKMHDDSALQNSSNVTEMRGKVSTEHLHIPLQMLCFAIYKIHLKFPKFFRSQKLSLSSIIFQHMGQDV